MIWADDIVGRIEERCSAVIADGRQLLIRDEKTLSGRVHVGSLRGIAIHGLIAQLLQEKGIDAVFRFELNDADPMDGLPVNIDQERFRPYMGQPLFTVPAPDGTSENFPMQYGDELQETIRKLHVPIEYYRPRPLYEEGRFNDVIAKALDHAAEIRAIYKEVSGGEKRDDWHPLSVICENCGKIGTTHVTAWDGEQVHYTCRKNMVSWAEGCEHEGSCSPFDGNAKLPWKVEWPAKWTVLGVHIEGAGKDHSAAGGAREIAKRISEEIFDYPEPFDIPYEFINLTGKKMSSSKGLGAAAKDIADLLPPEILRLFLMRKKENQPIDFDPDGETIPQLFDEYDRLSDHYFGRHKEPDADLSRKFAIAHGDLHPQDLWQMRFSVLSFVLQMPHLDLYEEAEKLKGSALTDAEHDALQERAAYVDPWLKQHAPDQYRFHIQDEVPEGFELDDEQKNAFQVLADALKELSTWDGPTIHEAIHAVKEQTDIAPKQIFQPLYQLFLGRNSGPQVGWFLSTFQQSDVVDRLSTIA